MLAKKKIPSQGDARKKFIPSLRKWDVHYIWSHEDKDAQIKEFFTSGISTTPPRHMNSIENDVIAGFQGKEKRDKAAIIMYTLWNSWKERNRTIFNQQCARPDHVFRMIKDDMKLRELAYGGVDITK